MRWIERSDFLADFDHKPLSLYWHRRDSKNQYQTQNLLSLSQSYSLTFDIIFQVISSKDTKQFKIEPIGIFEHPNFQGNHKPVPQIVDSCSIQRSWNKKNVTWRHFWCTKTDGIGWCCPESGCELRLSWMLWWWTWDQEGGLAKCCWFLAVDCSQQEYDRQVLDMFVNIELLRVLFDFFGTGFDQT